MRELVRRLRRARFRYDPLITVLINRAALEHNFAEFTRAVNVSQTRQEALRVRPIAVAPVLKSNAYGHGLISVAHIVDKLNPPFLVIDSYFEALVLRNEKIRAALLVMGYTPLANIARARLADVQFVLMGMEQLREIAEGLRQPRRFHLKIDTGMHRQGILESELDEALRLIMGNHNIRLEGLCTHLADADGTDPSFTREQIKRWNTVVVRVNERLQKNGVRPVRYTHVAATAGTRFSRDITASVVRLGLGLYGISTAPDADPRQSLDVRPVLSLQTSVTSVRTLEPGQQVGYNATWTASRRSHIATIPVGYYEGLNRRLSNKGFVLVNGNPCPIVGRVSMNIASLDVTDAMQTQVGDAALVYSADPTQPNSIARAAAACETIPYDLLVHIPTQLRRVVV